MATAIIMMGLPGSGKSTWAEAQSKEVVSADQYRMIDGQYVFNPADKVHEKCLAEFIYWCEVGCDIICDNTNTNLIDIAPYIAVAQAHGYDVRVVCCEGVGAFDRQTHGVPWDAWQRMSRQLEDCVLNWPKRWPEIEWVMT